MRILTFLPGFRQHSFNIQGPRSLPQDQRVPGSYVSSENLTRMNIPEYKIYAKEHLFLDQELAGKELKLYYLKTYMTQRMPSKEDVIQGRFSVAVATINKKSVLLSPMGIYVSTFDKLPKFVCVEADSGSIDAREVEFWHSSHVQKDWQKRWELRNTSYRA